MIRHLRVKNFKSIESVDLEPGKVNVLIGANGSGKSNLLEAIGVLSAAAGGRVDDESLLRRGVRPGVPALYKSAFAGSSRSLHISFGAWTEETSYEVSLFNPIDEPLPYWRYHTENLKDGNRKIVGRSYRGEKKPNPEAGLAALKTVEMKEGDPALTLLETLRDFAIYSPNTDALRGISPDLQQRKPVGLSGGQLSNAVSELKNARGNEFVEEICGGALSLIDWATNFGTAPVSSLPFSGSVGSTRRVVKFTDRYMNPTWNTLSGYDASEGALFILFHAVLAGHPGGPRLFAVDNADHSLNPRLARALFQKICDWYLGAPRPRQIFMTTHNPLALDGLALQNEEVRLFTVFRTDRGRTEVQRVVLDDKIQKMAEKGWSLSRLWVMGHLGGRGQCLIRFGSRSWWKDRRTTRF
ncbi:MAG: AAA family ATPase [Desulfococcaceae bacterium]